MVSTADGAAVQLCSRCEAHPRMPGQRWCRACFTEYRRHARARGKGGPTNIHPAPPVVRFWCRQYPFLRIGIPGGGVQFQDGLLETADPMVIAAIRKNDFYGGIIQEGEQPPPPPPATLTPERPRVYPPIIPRRVAGDWTHPWRVKDT